MDVVAVVFERVRVGLAPQGMTFGAPDDVALQVFRNRCTGHAALQLVNTRSCFGCRGGMSAFLPVGNDPRMENGVAIQALLGGIADGCITAGGRPTGKKDQNRYDHQ